MKFHPFSFRLVCEIGILLTLAMFIQKTSYSQNRKAKASLRGTVTAEGNVVVANVKIVAVPTGGKSPTGKPIPAVVNKNNGKYRIEKIKAGNYILKVFGKFIKPRDEPAKIFPGNSNLVDIKVECITKQTAVSGKLVDSSGAPLRNARVVLYSPDLPPTVCESCFVDEARSNEQGEIAFHNLGAGENYHLEVRLNDKSTTQVGSVSTVNTITLGSEPNTQVEFLVSGNQVVARVVPRELPPERQKRPQETALGNGQRVKFRGIVTKRDGESFLMGDTMGGPQTVVRLTPSTEVKSHKRGAFRGSKEYGATYILRGLRLEVDGVGNDQGEIVATRVRFDEQDLRTAQALKATLDSVESEMTAKLKAQQEEQERLAGQIEETSAVANAARAEAQAAEEAAKKAQQTADYANNRINGLDDFDPIRTITINFATNSSVLGPKAKQTIDEVADWVRAQPNRQGWVLAVVGFADTTGNTARNRTLSEKRANSVIYYLVTKHSLPLNKLVQPFGYGELEAVADNKTASGRAKNRRVEIRLMRNKGISGFQ